MSGAVLVASTEFGIELVWGIELTLRLQWIARTFSFVSY